MDGTNLPQEYGNYVYATSYALCLWYMGDLPFKTRTLIVSIFLIFYLFHWIYAWIEIWNSRSWIVPHPYTQGNTIQRVRTRSISRPFASHAGRHFQIGTLWFCPIEESPVYTQVPQNYGQMKHPLVKGIGEHDVLYVSLCLVSAFLQTIWVHTVHSYRRAIVIVYVTFALSSCASSSSASPSVT